jgi:hypothetical protein
MNSVTLCITMGRRPQLLRQTLSSLLKQAEFENIIGINDFRDEETNQVFKDLCPNGYLISLDSQLGHHAAVDYMYDLVTTPWVFHCEDDWLFEKSIDLRHLIKILESEKSLSAICLRQKSDFSLTVEEDRKVTYVKSGFLDFYRLDSIHDQWHGYTFNPHLASIDLWRSIGPFSNFKKERHISRVIRKKELFIYYLVNGGCSHLGANDSVSNSNTLKKSIWKRWLWK